jgi:hypothetical protein
MLFKISAVEMPDLLTMIFTYYEQCFDHFLEGDTELHSWEVLCELLKNKEARGIMCDVGM